MSSMTIQTTTTPTTESAGSSTRFSLPSRLGGIGGLVFASSILLQNALRASAPANDASPEKIISYYADHRGVALALAMLFPFGAAGLAAFVATMVSRARGSERVAALVGGVAGTAVIGMFGVVTATELALSTYVHRGAPDPSVVSALWLTHMSVFSVNLTFVGLALAGLSAVSAATGLLPRAWKTVGLCGGAALAIGGACAPAILNASPVFGVALIGFATWAVFVVVASISLLRHSATD